MLYEPLAAPRYANASQMVTNYAAVRERLLRKPLPPISHCDDQPSEPWLTPLPPLPVVPRYMAAIITLAPVEEVKISAVSIMSAVAAAHDISIADMKGPRRHTRFVAARHHAVAIICQCRPDLSYPVIGMLMNRDHSTIIYGRRHWPKIAGRYRTQRSRVADIIGFQWMPESSK